MLSTSLIGVVAQRLVRTVDNRGRLAAVEILVNNPAVANIIREGKADQLENVIQSGALQGMQTLDGALRKMLDEKLISGTEAYRHARNKSHFEQYRLLQDEVFS
jgi:twitching motility protein PilT